MATRMARPMARYETTIDRAGLALAAGGLMGGVIVAALVALATGQLAVLRIAIAFAIGTVFMTLAITAVAGPIWFALHLGGRRTLSHAVLTGVGTAMAIFVFAQTYGFGMFAMPATDGQTLIFRWISAFGTSLILAAIAGAIGGLMWRIAYRRAG